MQLRYEQLAPHLAKGLKRVYTLHGDEPLLTQEASDAIRVAARDGGYTERQVHTVAGAHFDWSSLLGATQAMSLFSARQFIEIRVPSGKPGKEGAEAFGHLCASLSDELVILVTFPRLDRTQLNSVWFGALDAAGVSIKIDPVSRHALPEWLAQRLAAQGQRVVPDEPGQQALRFFADQVEGNLLAAHQEVQKLALLYPRGALTLAQIEAAVTNVARYDVFKLTEAVLAGQVSRVLRMLDGLQAEGEAPVLVHWALAEDIRALRRVKDAQVGGKPLPVALKEQRIWGAKEGLFERVIPLAGPSALGHLVEAAQVCDGIVKGLPHPEWPHDPWEALRRLALMMMTVAQGPQRKAPRLVLRTRYSPASLM